MNGFKISVNTETKDFDHHTFLAPSNVVVPAAVGMYFWRWFSFEENEW